MNRNSIRSDLLTSTRNSTNTNNNTTMTTNVQTNLRQTSNYNNSKSPFSPISSSTSLSSSMQTSAIKSNKNLNNILINNNTNSNNTSVNNQVCVIGEKKRVKVHFIQTTQQQQQQQQPHLQSQQTNVSILINPKTWPNLRPGDLVEITSSSTGLTTSSAQGVCNTNQININVNTNQLNNSLNRGSALNLASSTAASTAFVNNANNATNLNLSQNSHMPQQMNSNSLHLSHSTNSFVLDENAEASPFLLQITQGSFSDLVPIDNIRIDQAASTQPFSLKALTYVNLTIVDKSSVILDLVELVFKEQYFNGNDMLRIKKYMENTCVYIKKNIECCGMRCTVRDMWSPNGDLVTCGYISDKTRLVFRSQSAMCTIYIQMSREMWEFDVNGEMYHEKAINFLGELFTNWKTQTCQHDVTIALFSRIFYNAKSLDEFPSSISEDIKKDHKGRYFEDFYRVVYQNERYEDWNPTLVILKRLIKEYRDYILNYHRTQLGVNVPEGYLSSAAEGNFLETLNLSSSVFERHFIDRPFDRTGMMSLVITPGNGIYEVSRELTKLTKERVIDNGIGSDLVCLGEQPLHCVPLFKYDSAEAAYSIPHWINLSFFKSSETVRYCNSSFLPSSKIKIKKKPLDQQKQQQQNNETKPQVNLSESILPGYTNSTETYLKSLEETDYIFENFPAKKTHSDSLETTITLGTSKRIGSTSKVNSEKPFTSQLSSSNKPRRPHTSSMSISSNEITSASQSNINNQQQVQDDLYEDHDDDSSLEFESDSEQQSCKVISETIALGNEQQRLGKSKINPFMPSSIKPRMSFERRRWAHIFPLRSDGTPIFPNWTTVRTNSELVSGENVNLISPPLLMPQMTSRTSGSSNILSSDFSKVSPTQASSNGTKKLGRQYSGGANSKNKFNVIINKENWDTLTSEESMATMKTGVAWKSLTIPACLPLTTDFFPNKNAWNKNFSCSSNYSLLLNEIREQYSYSNYDTSKITMAQVFTELVGHRLALGFQMVVSKDWFKNSSSTINNNNNNINNNSNSKIGDTSTSNSANQLSTTPTNSSFNYGLVSSNNVSLHNTYNTMNFICDRNDTSFFRTQMSSIKGYYKLSLGRIYHELFYVVDDATKTDYVRVEIYKPKEKKDRLTSLSGQLMNTNSNKYKYRFQVPDSKTYDISYCDMSRKNIESIKWNDIDSYICIQGNGSLTPGELQKCWRQRLYLIPLMYVQSNKLSSPNTNSTNINDPSTPQQHQLIQFTSNTTGSSYNAYSMLTLQNLTPAQIPASMLQHTVKPARCDIYQRKSVEELKFFRDYYFIKFVEHLNKLNRADEKRSYSKSMISYLESNLSSHNTSNDYCLATNAINNMILAQTHSINSFNLATSSNSSSSSSLTTVNSLSNMATNSSSGLFNINNSASNSNIGGTRGIQYTMPNFNLKQILATYSSSSEVVKVESPKRVLMPLLIEYFQVLDEILRLEKERNNATNFLNSNSSSNNDLTLNSSSTTTDSNDRKNIFTKNLKNILNKHAQSSFHTMESLNLLNQQLLSNPNGLFTTDLTSLLEQIKKLRSKISNYLDDTYKKRMLDNVNGFPFIQNKNDIPLNCFISSEAVWWCISHVADIENEADAILLMQIMSDFDLVRHISINQKIFIHGFYLYYIVTDENKKNQHLYTKDYLEVGFCDIDCTRQNSTDPTPTPKSMSLVSVKDLLPESSNTLPVTGNEMFRAYLKLFSEYSRAQFFNMSSDAYMKLVNVDVDVNRRSNRVEWASAVYRSYYHPLCAFELEIQWEMATGSLLSELIFSWSKLANRFNCHLVPAPVDPFAVPLVANSDPLRGSLYIKLNLNCMIQNENVLFESFIDNKYKFNLNDICALTSTKNGSSPSTATIVNNGAVLTYKFLAENYKEFVEFLLKKYLTKEMIEKRLEEEIDFCKQELHEFIETERINYLQYFQEAILEKFGFIRNAAIVKSLGSDEDPVHFIHSTGGMFVCIPNYFNGFSMRSRHTSANTNNNNNSINNSKSTESTTPSSSYSFLNRKDRHLDTIKENIDQHNKNSNAISIDHIDSNNEILTALNNSNSNASLNTNLIPQNNLQKRERSHSKSQHLEFLRLNGKNYLTNITSSSSIESINDLTLTSTSIEMSTSSTTLTSNLMSKSNDTSSSDISTSTCENIDTHIDSNDHANSLTTQFNLMNKEKQTNNINNDAGFKSKPFYAESEAFIGFLWSWNFMLGKKWRSQFTGDESFQDNMLADFRLFCSNQDGRLQAFFNETKDLLR